VLKSIHIKNYRNIQSLQSELSEYANLIVAPNGSGKTNILEAIHYSVFGESFRPLNTADETIGPKDNFAKITSKWDLDTLDVTISNINGVLNRNFQLNLKKYPISKISVKFPIILFAPHTLDLVIGEPSIRRVDLNEYLSILYPNYRAHINKYRVLLKNRNAVLKQLRENRVPRDILTFWTGELINTSDLIYKERYKYFQDIQQYFTEAIESLFKNEERKGFEIGIQYNPNQNVSPEEFKELLTSKFRDNIEKEIIVGKTLYGVHKDDFTLLLNGENLRFKGSRGQQRIGILILKIAQLQHYYSKFQQYPLLLLDDLMSELDQKNRERVGHYLMQKKIQFIITTADVNEVPEFLRNQSRLIDLSK
jgi:DNA replication and repair protein RecF